MGYDIVSTWSPRVGASGDDLYTLPAETEFSYGAVSYSIPPSIAEINAGDMLNQIIAAINRRSYYYNTAFGTTLKIFPYMFDSSAKADNTTTGFSSSGDFGTVTTGTAHGYVAGETVYLKTAGSATPKCWTIYEVPSTTTFKICSTFGFTGVSGTGIVYPTNDVAASHILNLMNTINSIRSAEGLTSYTFSTSETVALSDIKASHIFELRKSLRISGTFTKNSGTNLLNPSGPAKFNGHSDASYPSWISYAQYLSGLGDYYIGKTGQTTYMNRARVLVSYRIPEWYTGADGAVLSTELYDLRQTMENVAAIDVYRSDADDWAIDTSNAPNGSMANIDNLEISDSTFSVGLIDFVVDEAAIAGYADGHVSYIIGTKDEIDGTGVYDTSTSHESVIDIINGILLIIDLGA